MVAQTQKFLIMESQTKVKLEYNPFYGYIPKIGQKEIRLRTNPEYFVKVKTGYNLNNELPSEQVVPEGIVFSKEINHYPMTGRIDYVVWLLPSYLIENMPNATMSSLKEALLWA